MNQRVFDCRFGWIRPLVLCAVLLMTTVPMTPAEKNQQTEGTETSGPEFWKTHTFDNTRFFTDHSKGGVESGSDGWVRITAKGYREYIHTIDPRQSALIVVDLYGSVTSFAECDWAKQIAKYDKEQADIWADRMDNVVVPNVVKLLKLFREKKVMVVYLAIGGEPRPEMFPPQIAPQPGDKGVSKFSSGAFATSTLDNLLRENGIKTLFFVGHDTCGCVSQTMAGAYDRSYQTILISDACFSSVPELHDAAVKIWAYKGYVRTTEQVLKDYPWQAWIDPGLRKKTDGKSTGE